MNFKNIQMTVVRRTSDGVKLNISKIDEENRRDKYECIMCGSEVIPVAVNNKTISGDNAKVTPYFKHKNANNCGAENFKHFWAKTEYIKIGDTFKVITDRENEYICNQIFFEKSYATSNKNYKPDATILTSCGKTIYFEFKNTNNKKVREYIDRWKYLNNIVVEVNIKTLDSAFYNIIPTFNALYYEGKCFNLNEEDNLYYNTIGKYKLLTEKDKDYLQNQEIEIGKLDALWDETRKIKYDDKGFEDIGNLIRSISSEDSRKIAIDMLNKVSCGGSILKNYVSFIYDKIDKRLKILNLKYNGYLIRYKIYVPHLIYDRIFSGITIAFYIPDDDQYPEFYNTYDYDFKDEILSDILKSRIDNVIKGISLNHDKMIHILKILELNSKIINHKLHYKESTDYIDAIYFKDYRGKEFIMYSHYYTFKEVDIEKYNYVDIFKANEDVIFIDLKDDLEYKKDLNIFIKETNNSYKFSNIAVKYKYNKLFKQKELNLTYKFINDFKFLPRYNFVKIISELAEVKELILNYEREFIIPEEYYNKIYRNNEIIEITDLDLNKRIEKLLYPIIYVSNRSIYESLNIIFNSNFTQDETGYRPWLIKDFIEILEKLTNIEINNIK